MTIQLINGNCLEVLETIPTASVHSVITDPPYHIASIVSRFEKTSKEDDNKTGKDALERRTSFSRLAVGFMGTSWDDGDIAFKTPVWKECLRVLKPGGHIVSFGLPKLYHRMATAVEDAGFEIRDGLDWMFATGFPKSHDLGDGWGTGLTPQKEWICLGRKPPDQKTLKANRELHETAGLNIEASRNDRGNWPGNVLHDGCIPEAKNYFFTTKATRSDKESWIENSINYELSKNVPLDVIEEITKYIGETK